MPIRIQRKRLKGWRAPEGTVNCTRQGEYGNPFVIGGWYLKGDINNFGPWPKMIYTRCLSTPTDKRFIQIKNAAEAVEWYRWYISASNIQPKIKRDLAGKNLMCFCALDQPCHVDVLLSIANS
jgi:Domain of unknown function (DUF4326)